MADHPMISLIVAAIEKHGPMTCEQLVQYIPLTVNAIYRNCKLAVEADFLQCRRVKNGKSSGRRLLKFYVSEGRHERRAQAELERLARARAETELRRIERERLTNFKPFRDELTTALYGEYQREVA